MAAYFRILFALLMPVVLVLLQGCRQEKAKATELKDRFSQELNTGSRPQENTPSSNGRALFTEKSCDMCHSSGDGAPTKVSLKGRSAADITGAKVKSAHEGIRSSWPSEEEAADIAQFLSN